MISTGRRFTRVFSSLFIVIEIEIEIEIKQKKGSHSCLDVALRGGCTYMKVRLEATTL